MAAVAAEADAGELADLATLPSHGPPAGWYRYPVTVAILSRLLSLLAVGMVGWVTRPTGSTDLVRVFTEPLGRWDGVWYLTIAEHGYDPTIGHANTAAFFPLFPAVVRALVEVSPLGYAAAAVVASNLLFVAALVAVYRLTLDRFGVDIARRAITYLAIAPLAFVFSAAYTESLFLLLTACTFLLMERGRIGQAAGVAALAVLCRPVGILLAPALAWRVFDEHGRRPSWRLVRALLPLVVIPLALAAFQIYLYERTGQAFATNAAEVRGWGRKWDVLHVFTLPVAFLHGFWIALDQQDVELAVSACFASLWAWLAISLWRRRVVPIEYIVFTSLALLLPAATGTYLGMPRFGLVAIPLFWALALLGRDERVDHIVRTLFPALLVGLAFVAYGVGTFTP